MNKLCIIQLLVWNELVLLEESTVLFILHNTAINYRWMKNLWNNLLNKFCLLLSQAPLQLVLRLASLFKCTPLNFSSGKGDVKRRCLMGLIMMRATEKHPTVGSDIVHCGDWRRAGNLGWRCISLTWTFPPAL